MDPSEITNPHQENHLGQLVYVDMYMNVIDDGPLKPPTCIPETVR